jgi:hypothetical protein
MDAMPTCGREAGNHYRLGRGHGRVITAIFTLLEIVLVGLVIASLFAIAIASHVVSSLPATRFHASANRHADRMT